MELSIRTSDKNPERGQKYDTEIDSIVGQSLTPESIDTYADEALERLIEVIDRATADYSRQPTLRFDLASDTENATFGYYGLQNVELLLDTIADKADELHLIDDLIAQAHSVDMTLLPPDQWKPTDHERGNGTVETKKLIPKLKTLLFVASNDFNVDIADPEQLQLMSGALPEMMMRGQSYYHVEFPMLARSALICDEAENITFIFDDLALKKYEITSFELTTLTKSDIKALIADDPSLGRQLIYSKHFIPHLINALEDPATRPKVQPESDLQELAGSYLYPKAPEGFMSATGLGKEWKIAGDTINGAVAELGDTIGEVNQYKFSQKAVKGYSPEQQALLRQHFEAKGVFSEAAPEGYMTAKGLSRYWEVSDTSIYKAITGLGDTIGEVGIYKFGKQVFTGYSPEQQAQIRLQLEVQGTFAAPVPEGYTSEAGLRAEWGINTVTINKAIKVLGDSLGELIYFRFGNKRTIGYSPEQQAIIRQYLEAKGNFNNKAPEGYISVRGMANTWELSFGVVDRIVDELAEQLGVVDRYKFGRSNILAAAYSPEQQAMIKQRLEEKGVFAEQPPEGYFAAGSLGLMWKGVGQAAVYKAIDKLSDSLGEVRQYKFMARVVKGYSPEQQEIIKQYLMTEQHKVIE